MKQFFCAFFNRLCWYEVKAHVCLPMYPLLQPSHVCLPTYALPPLSHLSAHVHTYYFFPPPTLSCLPAHVSPRPLAHACLPMYALRPLSLICLPMHPLFQFSHVCLPMYGTARIAIPSLLQLHLSIEIIPLFKFFFFFFLFLILRPEIIAPDL